MLATLLNSCAAGMFTAWVVAPGAAFLYGATSGNGMRAFLLGVPIGISGAFMLHAAARMILGGLRE